MTIIVYTQHSRHWGVCWMESPMMEVKMILPSTSKTHPSNNGISVCHLTIVAVHNGCNSLIIKN